MGVLRPSAEGPRFSISSKSPTKRHPVLMPWCFLCVSIVSGGKGKGKGEKAAGASASVSRADYDTDSTMGALSTRAPTGSGASDDLDNMTHVGAATQVSGSGGAAGGVGVGGDHDRLGRKRQARKGAARGRVGGDPPDDEGGSSDDQGSSDDDNDEDYNPPDDNDDDDEDEDDEPESSGSGGDHLSDSTFKQPKAAGKAAGPTAPTHQSTVRGVRFDDKRQTWSAMVKMDGKWKPKSFSVSKHGGYDEAKAEAEACRRQNEQDNEKAGRPIMSRNKNEITGVYHDDENGYWIASWYENGKQKQEYFSVAKMGEKRAKETAIKRRKDMEKIWPDQRKSVPSLGRGRWKLIDQLLAKNVKGVYFDKGNKAWGAYWEQGGRKHLKTFTISTHGDIEEAYDKAVACRKEAEASGAASLRQPVEKQSGHRGVRWCKKSKAWVANWVDASGKRRSRNFSLSEYGGDSEAKAEAIHCRKTMVAQTEREKQDRLVSSRKRPSEAPEGRRVRRKTNK
ncbi:unnamed protein product [Vitrella brassicaformis CCMP3155]|uniref:AP2/ERF domain-containing protein n=1 Tax=Vitrella brassicaformis (strain CCMP3155) TaxID=1169540 RepID=A0A0G4GLK2_VITBC|nr:unnamed protein product [Vitrella brassicaformis CCMP3155]|eukprot:CEM31017.1 unnamed protein product [Vitrella brassicaformis CCMP3155]